MFECDANLFFSASKNINYAKTLINECKKKINEYEVSENDNFKSAKKNINECNVDAIIDVVETTKQSLLRFDKEFSETYMSLLQSSLPSSNISFENMSSEELLEYTVAARDYDYTILYMLEQHGEDELTDEMSALLKVQRIKIEQYELIDDMSVLPSDSKEFLEKFKQKSDLDRELLKLMYPGEDLEQKLKEYNQGYNEQLAYHELNYNINIKTQELKKLEAGSKEFYKKENEIRQLLVDYYSNKGSLTKEEEKMLKFQKDYIEVNNYYIAGEEDKARTKKTKMYDPVTGECVATQAEIDYENANWLGRAWMDTKTVLATNITSIAGVGESLSDGFVMLTAGTVGLFNDDVAKWTKDYVSITWSDDAYDGMVLSGGLNGYSAYSGYHTVTDFLVTTGTYVGLSFIPGAGGSAVMASAASGSTAQTAFDSGASYKDALGASWISGGLAFASDMGLDKLNAAKDASLALKTAGRTAIGVGEPMLNTATEYILYGHENSDNILDYADKTGAYTNMVIGGTVANVSGLISDYKHKTPKTDLDSNVPKVDTNPEIQKAPEVAVEPEFKKASEANVDADPQSIFKKTVDDIFNMLKEKQLIPDDFTLEKVNKIFKGDYYGSDGKLIMSKEDAIKRTMNEVLVTGGGRGKTAKQLFEEFGMVMGETPEPGTLNCLQTRVWYLTNVEDIPNRLDKYVELNPNATLKEKAEFCCNERNNVRKAARDAMADSELRDYLNGPEKNISFDEIFDKRKTELMELNSDRIITDEEVYEAIINGSKKHRLALDELLGIGV